MTEPSDEAHALADRYESNTFSARDLARDIDDLTEQRVAAAVERCAVTARGGDHAECEHGEGYIDGRLDAEAAIRAAAARPAPEGAAPTIPPLALTEEQAAYLRDLRERETNYDPETIIGRPDLARPRCSTPSQEDTQPGCGTSWRPRSAVPDDEVDIVGYQPEIGDANADEMPSHYGITTGKWLRYGGWEACTHWTPLPSPPNAAGCPGSASNTESSPTQTVAAPGPTAGDVERAVEANRLAMDILDQVSSQITAAQWDTLHGSIAAALRAVQGSARAELLAQIREPSDEVLDVLFGSELSENTPFMRKLVKARFRILADKLTEAK